VFETAQSLALQVVALADRHPAAAGVLCMTRPTSQSLGC
jgi:hypothetical protein